MNHFYESIIINICLTNNVVGYIIYNPTLLIIGPSPYNCQPKCSAISSISATPLAVASVLISAEWHRLHEARSGSYKVGR